MTGRFNRPAAIAWALLPLLLAAVPAAAALSVPGPVEIALRAEIDRLPAPEDWDGAAEPGRAAPDPRRAFLFSLVVPGSGQLYASGWDLTSWSAARAAVYVSFETVAWVQQQKYRNRGWDKQAEYRAYADKNWHWRADCADWNGGDGAIDNDPFVYEPNITGDWYIDTDPEYLEFYEDIHKLQKWICGWDDYGHVGQDDGEKFEIVEGSGIYRTPLSVEYTEMRREQNELMTNADHWQRGIVANHILSAFDAFFTARRIARGEGEGNGPLLRFGAPAGGPGASLGLAWRF
ncbi:MAG: hypothetical protein JW958_08275 [Candidatus Eisenbacteria bacterium]|nr:hypothetical protein [Candidatus Eisenbacteria bacterium]